VSVDPTPLTRPRHPLRRMRPSRAFAAPCPLPSKRQCWSNATTHTWRLGRFASSPARRSGVSRCAKGACGAVGEAGGAARKSLGRRRSRAGTSRFDDAGAPRRSPERGGLSRFENNEAARRASKL